MSEQDAQDLNQMMSSSSEVPIAAPKKSNALWITLSCIVVGVGLGIIVYKQSISVPTPNVKPTLKPTTTIIPSAIPSPIPSPIIPETNVITPQVHSVTFPKTGKIRIYSSMTNLQQLMTLTIAGQAKEVTIQNQVSTTNPMISGDSTFIVSANSTASFDLYVNGKSGLKMKSWILPLGTQKKDCGIKASVAHSFEKALAYVTGKLAGESIFLSQCWEDNDTPGEFNDAYVLWTYVPGSTTTSTSPSASPSVSPSLSPSPSPSRAASPSPSPSIRASVTPTPTPTPSPRISMPDTSGGTPVTGIFEITVGTVSVGLVFLVLGLFGLLVL